jgi:spoIIIJ-associated protein
MAQHREFKGRSLEECLNEASETLGLPDEKIHYRLLDEGRKGVFGLGARDVRILVELPAAQPEVRPRPDEQAPNRRPGRRRAGGHQREQRGGERRDGEATAEGKSGGRGVRRRGPRGRGKAGTGANRPGQSAQKRSGEKRRAARTAPARGDKTANRSKPGSKASEAASAEHRDDIVRTVGHMFRLMGMELEGEASANKNGLVLELDGADTDMLLENDAELLFAVQFLLNRMSRRAWPGTGRIQLTCTGFRSRRDEDLVSEVREVAGQVARTGEPKRFQPMNPYERRLVHLTIREFPGLASRSEGQGFMKAITVSRTENAE